MAKTKQRAIQISAAATLAWTLVAAGYSCGNAFDPAASSGPAGGATASGPMAAGATASGASGAATAGAASSREATPQGQQSASSGMFLTTNAFKPGAMMPKEFTCDGVDSSPELDWSNPPEKTRSFALIVDDPDAPAGTWVHWVVYDMPAGTRHLPEGVPKRDEIQSGGRQGINDFHEAGYNGPCPPPGGPHRYFFKLYALDTFLNLKARSTKSGVERAMVGHVLAKSELMGRYGRE